MILVAGLTPAWQQIAVLERLAPGAVNRARETYACASGKPTNVAIALARLGATAKLLTVLGGAVRSPFEEDLDRLGVERRILPSTAPTRVCTSLVDRSARETTEIVENAGPASAEELAAFQETFREEARAAQLVVLTGSLPPGAPATFYSSLLHATPARAVLDIRGPELLETLAQRPFLMKPNRDELARTVARSLDTEDELVQACRDLCARGATWVVVTAGAGAVIVVSREQSFRMRTLPRPVVNPIGCGDCLAAGLAWGLSRGKEVVESTRLGIAAAAQNLGDLLPARLDPATVSAWAEEVEVSPLGA